MAVDLKADKLRFMLKDSERLKVPGGSCSIFKSSYGGEDVIVKQVYKEYRRFYEAEKTILMQLQHANIVRLVAFCDEERALLLPFIGHSLLTYIEEEDTLNWADTLRVMQQIASALEYLHEKGFIHRDPKPHNILIAQAKKAVLIDFGCSIQKCEGKDCEELTGAYAAPEIASGSTFETDTYSYGVTMLQLLMAGSEENAAENAEVEHLQEPHKTIARAQYKNGLNRHVVCPRLMTEGCSLQHAQQVSDVLLRCVRDEATLRPDMTAISTSLNLPM